jgi:hypothetical protein
MLAASEVGMLGHTVWADLGCGSGVFTLALASLLAAGSSIHAIDRDSSALLGIPARHDGVRITTHLADMTMSRVVPDLDGIIMANSLHYVSEQRAFIDRCVSWFAATRRFLIVEYDTDEASRWVPFPVSRRRLPAIFDVAGDVTIRFLASRRSIYRRAPLYAALVVAPAPSTITTHA